MGRFQNLSQVGLVLAEVIDSVVAAGTEIRLNVPIENPLPPRLQSASP